MNVSDAILCCNVKSFFLVCFAGLYGLPYFLYLSRRRRDIVINIRRPLCKISFILFRFSTELCLFTLFSGSPQYRNFCIIRPVRSKFFHTDEQA